MIRRCDLVAVLICIFHYCNAHLIIFTCNLRTISVSLLLFNRFVYYIAFLCIIMVGKFSHNEACWN